MEEKEEILNRVAQSSLITFDLEDYYHHGERVVFDLKDFLYQDIILKEKDYRDKINLVNWADYKDKNVAISCSVDAVIPNWAYMLAVTKLAPYAHIVILGDLRMLENALYIESLSHIDFEKYRDKKVVIKGCGQFPVPESAYVEITRKLMPVVSGLMYGEPCSTVPLYKKK